MDVLLQLECWVKDDQDHHVFWLNRLLSSAIYSMYYSRYSTPYLSGEGEEGELLVVVVVVREQETLLLDTIE